MARWFFTFIVTNLFVTLTTCLDYVYSDGSHYSGPVDEDGLPSGLGLLYSSEGDIVYNGTFREGKWDGRGVWYGSSEERYEGEFSEGVAEGLGVWWTQEGGRVEGEFKDHRLNGEAIWYWPSGGKRMEGDFRRGLVHGQAIYHFGQDTRFLGEFRKGVPHGRAVLVDKKSGSLLWQGLFHEGKTIKKNNTVRSLEEEFLMTGLDTNQLRLKRMKLNFQTV